MKRLKTIQWRKIQNQLIILVSSRTFVKLENYIRNLNLRNLEKTEKHFRIM